MFIFFVRNAVLAFFTAPGTIGLSVDIQVDECGKIYVYIDDFITIGPDNDEILERITKAPITVIHAIADNSLRSDKIPRGDIVAEDIAEGAAEERKKERKICLGWMLDTRRLLVNFPDHKAIRMEDSNRYDFEEQNSQ